MSTAPTAAPTADPVDLDPWVEDEPAPDPAPAPWRRNTGAATLDQTRAFIARFCTMPSDAALDLTVAWIAHSHCVDGEQRLAFETSPRLAFLSDLPASGKSKALELIQALCHNGQVVVDPTPASFALATAEKRASVLIDEIDILFGNGASKAVLRSLLNAGYRRKIATWQRAGKDDLNIFSAVALAGLGTKFRTAKVLSPLRSRTIMIDMVPARTPEVYHARKHDPMADEVRGQLRDWVHRATPEILESWPDMPPELSGRDAEVAEPLLMIADAAGGSWPDRIRTALLELVVGTPTGQAEELPLLSQLLRDLYGLFGTEEKLSTVAIVQALYEIPGAPWSTLWPDRTTAPRELSALLGPLDVAPVKVRLGEATVRGYRAADLAPHWLDVVGTEGDPA